MEHHNTSETASESVRVSLDVCVFMCLTVQMSTCVHGTEAVRVCAGVCAGARAAVVYVM